MSAKRIVTLAALVSLLGMTAIVRGAEQQLTEATDAAALVPEFTEAFLSDPANYQLGTTVWGEQCRHCHGRDAYPGKAPRLKPRRYTADFVYDRVTNGFRKMPAWGEIFTEEERMSVVAYILSDDFSP